MSKNDTIEIMDVNDVRQFGQEFSYSKRVIEAGIWLIRNGWGQMQLLPYMAPSGCAWRCAFYPKGKLNKEFYRYTSASGAKFLNDHSGGTVRKTISPKSLANAIIKSVPEQIAYKCYGIASTETLRWLEQLERSLQNGYLPVAFSDGFSPPRGMWNLSTITGHYSNIPCQPGYVEPELIPKWFETRFWDGINESIESLENSDSFLLAFNDDELISRIAYEMKASMDDAHPNEIPTIFKAAIAKLVENINPEDLMNFEKVD